MTPIRFFLLCGLCLATTIVGSSDPTPAATPVSAIAGRPDIPKEVRAAAPKGGLSSSTVAALIKLLALLHPAKPAAPAPAPAAADSPAPAPAPPPADDTNLPPPAAPPADVAATSAAAPPASLTNAQLTKLLSLLLSMAKPSKPKAPASDDADQRAVGYDFA